MPHVANTFHQNRILAALPYAEVERLLPRLEPVHLRPGKVLYEVGDPINYVYFPTCGMVSLLSSIESGTSVEVAMISTEGMAGIPLILGVDEMPYRAVAQLAADALRLKATVLEEEMRRAPRLHELLHQYLFTVLKQITQSAVCHRFHTTEERFCRWLLTARDCANDDGLQLTQESIANMLGVPRTSVTMIAGKLQQLDLIRYSRRKITILDRQRLRAASCECYNVIAEEIKQFRAA